MMSKTGLHAVMALAALAELPRNERLGAVAIAKQIGAPHNYLGKLLQQLTRTGLVTSQKGLTGGFRLARTPDCITLYDIIDPIEGLSRWEQCGLGRNECSNSNPCLIHDRWKAIRDGYLDMLKNTRISDLLESGELKTRIENSRLSSLAAEKSAGK